MKVAVIGANGQLGSDLIKVFSRQHEAIPLNHTDIEVADIDSVKTVLSALKPDIVINTSAYHNVPVCEQHPDTAFAINGKGPLNLAKVCTDLDARLVHYSTDYVFDGGKRQPYTETDHCNPLNVYGITKLSGEHLALNYASRPFVIRVSGIYGETPCRAKGGNFITTMLKLAKEKPEVKVVNDEILTPTPTSAIAEYTSRLLEKDVTGLFHLTCEGECSWYEFARTIWDTLKLETPLYETSVLSMQVPVKRPFYSVLENKRFNELGIGRMPHWKEALVDFLTIDH
jgi:dTDP-4-dehydrorhamnose reductase